MRVADPFRPHPYEDLGFEVEEKRGHSDEVWRSGDGTVAKSSWNPTRIATPISRRRFRPSRFNTA